MKNLRVIIGMKVIYKFFTLLPLRKKTMLFEASQGRYTSNPKYLYEQILATDEFVDWSLIWVIRDDCKVPSNVKTIKIYSLAHLYYLATSRVLINDNFWHYYMKKRKKQLFIQTWHGTPLKQIGIDTNNPTNDPQVEQSNKRYVTSNAKLTNVMLSSSAYHSAIIRSAFLYKQEIMEIGTPRVDYLLNNNIQPNNSYPQFDKLVLIAPSYRKTLLGGDQFDFFFQGMEIEKLASLYPNYGFLIKLHNYGFASRREFKDNIIDVSGTADINQLYLMSDVLITDYSSALFDYSVLGKTNICYPFDYDFNTNRIITDDENLYFPINEQSLPALVATSFEQLQTLLETLPIKAPNHLTEYEQGTSSQQLIKYISEWIKD